jgi:hypothetical protein
MKCSWYNWDFRNKQILRIFLANSLKPFEVEFASIVLDYSFAFSVGKSKYKILFFHILEIF